MKNLIKVTLLLVWSITSCTEKPKDDKESVNTTSPTDTVKIVGGVSYINPQINSLGSQSCRDVMDKAAMNEFKFTSESEYRKALKNAIMLDYNEKTKSETSKSSSIGASLTDYFSFDSGNDEEKEEMRELMKKYRDNSTMDLTDNDRITIESKIVSDIAVIAWQKCMHDYFVSKQSLSIDISGDTEKDFITSINWSPKSIYEPTAVKISGVSFTSNLKKIGDDELHKGSKLKKFTGISQQFSRIGKGKASITVNVDGFPALMYEITPVVVPVPKPKAVFKPQWMKEDESGNKYYESFVDYLPQCYNCSDDDKFIDVNKILELSDKSGRIYDVKRLCEGGCGWSYNPDGGYEPKFQILAPNKFIWYRRIKGPATTETYMVYYEKERQICVENCK